MDIKQRLRNSSRPPAAAAAVPTTAAEKPRPRGRSRQPRPVPIPANKNDVPAKPKPDNFHDMQLAFQAMLQKYQLEERDRVMSHAMAAANHKDGKATTSPVNNELEETTSSDEDDVEEHTHIDKEEEVEEEKQLEEAEVPQPQIPDQDGFLPGAFRVEANHVRVSSPTYMTKLLASTFHTSFLFDHKGVIGRIHLFLEPATANGIYHDNNITILVRPSINRSFIIGLHYALVFNGAPSRRLIGHYYESVHPLMQQKIGTTIAASMLNPHCTVYTRVWPDKSISLAVLLNSRQSTYVVLPYDKIVSFCRKANNTNIPPKTLPPPRNVIARIADALFVNEANKRDDSTTPPRDRYRVERAIATKCRRVTHQLFMCTMLLVLFFAAYAFFKLMIR